MYLLKFYIYWKNQGKNRASVKIVLILCSVLYVNRTDVHSRSIVGDDVTRRRVHETEMLIIVIGNRFRLGFQRTLPTGLHKPSGGSHYRQQELIVRVRWHARVIFQGCYVEAASHRIASHLVGELGSATISRRHIDDLCMSVRIPEDHCSSLALY